VLADNGARLFGLVRALLMVPLLAARYWLLTIAALVVGALFLGAAYAAVLDSREAEQMTLANGATRSGSHVILNDTSERATWVDGGAAGGTSVTATARHNGNGSSRVGLALYVNGVNRGSQFWATNVTANAERTWTGLNLSASDDLQFRAVEVGSREAVLFDRARVDGTAQNDADGDGVADLVDNCPDVANANQADSDGDGIGDVCEPPVDSDGDSVPDSEDPFPNDPQEWEDTDGDGVGNNADACDSQSGPASNNGCPITPGDTEGPATSITGGPAAGSTVTVGTVTFTFSGTDNVGVDHFETRLVGTGSPEPNFTSTTANSKTYNSLPNGSYTFEVRAVDAAGNFDPTPAEQTFSVQTSTGSDGDLDNDGVADGNDYCPTVAGNNSNGCPSTSGGATGRIKAGNCDPYRLANIDPIAKANHPHWFYGGDIGSELSNETDGFDAKARAIPTCKSEGAVWITSMGWSPDSPTTNLTNNQFYYRDPGNYYVNDIPTDMRLFTMNHVFSSFQDNPQAVSQHFPNCVAVSNTTGRPLMDSPNHMTHLEDKAQEQCDSSHKYRIPRLSFLQHYSSTVTASTQFYYGEMQLGPAQDRLHADYLTGNQNVFNDELIDHCLNRNTRNVQSDICGPGP
jgi:hypothetical protein